MRPARAATWLLLLGLAGCPTVAPANEDLVAALERCATVEDQARFEVLSRLFAQGRHADVLAGARELIPRNPACAALPVLARRAVAMAPPAEQPALLEAMRSELTRLHADVDAGVRPNVAFALALFARTDKEKGEWLAVVLADDREHYFALVLEGERLYSRGELERARETLTRAVSLRRELAEAWLLLARVAEDRGLYRTADNHYRAYLGLRPLDRQVKMNYVRLLAHQLHDGGRAEPLVEDLYAADPTNVDIGLHRGLVYFLQKKNAEAEAVYKELLRRQPQEARVTLSLGNLYHGAMDEPLKALQAYRYLLTLPPSADPQILANQVLFVRSRLRDIEKELADRGIDVPPPPRSVDEILQP